jgi:hypothetical protein
MADVKDEDEGIITDEDGAALMDEAPAIPAGSITPTGAQTKHAALNRTTTGDC